MVAAFLFCENQSAGNVTVTADITDADARIVGELDKATLRTS